MLHTKFSENRLAGSGEFCVLTIIYGSGGHLGHVTRFCDQTFVLSTHGCST